MANRRQDFVLGLVVIGFIALFVGTIIFIYPRLGTTTRMITLHFKADEGLAPVKAGSPVLLAAAVQVGKVRSVQRVWTADDGKTPAAPPAPAILMIAVQAEVDAKLRLHDDCRITTDQPPVGGAGTVVILSVGTSTRPEVARTPEDILVGLPPQSLAAAIGSLSRELLGPNGIIQKVSRLVDPDQQASFSARVLKSLDDVNAITAALRTQMDPAERLTLMSKLQSIFDEFMIASQSIAQQLNREDSATLIAKLHRALDQVETGLTQANEILVENRTAITNTVSNVEEISAELRQSLVKLAREQLDPEVPESLIGKLHAAMDKLNGSLGEVQSAAAIGRRTLAANQPALERTIENAKAMSEQLRLASEEIRAAPWRLLYRPTPTEQDKLGVFEAARTFAEAATYLDDASARLESVLRVAPQHGPGTIDEAELQAVLASVRSAFQRFEKAETFLWEKMR